MPNRSRRLLFLLVLFSVALAASWTTAHARGGAPSSTVSPPTLSGSHTGAHPASGEPDVGQTPRVSPTKGHASPVPGGGYELPGQPGAPWFIWIFRMWMFSFIGAR